MRHPGFHFERRKGHGGYSRTNNDRRSSFDLRLVERPEP